MVDERPDVCVCDSESGDSTLSAVTPGVLLSVTNTLRAVCLIERCRSTALNTIQLTTRLTRIMCTFLAGTYLTISLSVCLSVVCLSSICMLLCLSVCLCQFVGSWQHSGNL